MKSMQYSFDEFKSSSLLVRSLVNELEAVTKYVSAYFSEEALIKQCDIKQLSQEKRGKLMSVLQSQNQNVRLSELSNSNISKLSDSKTYTITTGHQLNMATGPLYTLYKILEVINWCEKLNDRQNQNFFVPVFWMATEDHDFEEINHVNLFGSKIDWAHQNVENSVVGRLDVRPSAVFVEKVLEKFNDDDLRLKISELLAVYSKSQSLAEANRMLINDLFGKYGLVIIDGDDSSLKESFIPMAKLEIEEGITFSNVSATNEMLEKDGFHNQVFVRESNLFYIEESGERVRIEKANGSFKIGKNAYSTEELIHLLKKQSDRFSPNALLRPVYQEAILPNVAYVGGGGEIAYWMQLKSTFEKMELEFPVLKVRESVLLVDQRVSDQLSEFGYSIIELKGDIDEILKDYVTNNQTVELSLNDQKKSLLDLKATVLEKALQVDKNATTFIEAEFQKMENQLDKIEKKFIASEKKNQDKSIKQLKRLQNSFYPDGSFQERFENYLSYIQKPNFIEEIKLELKQRMTAKAAIQVINIK